MRIREFYDGGYMVCWTDAKHFKPKDMQTVLVHVQNPYGDDGLLVGYYHEREQIVSCDDFCKVEWKRVDWWMTIPPFPKEGTE